MDALGRILTSAIADSLVADVSGTLCVGKCRLAAIWSMAAQRMSAPGWKRFSDFLSGTSDKFLAGADGDAAMYKSHILLVMFYDLGMEVDPNEWNHFVRSLQPNLQRLQPAPRLPEPETVADETLEPVQEAAPARRLVVCDVVGGRAKSHMNAWLARDFSQGMPDTEADISTLVALLKDRDATIRSLRSDARRQGQKVRRLEQQLAEAKQKAQEQNQSRQLGKTRSLDLHRVHEADDLPSKKRKWSWLTPTGCINVAVTLAAQAYLWL